MKQAGQQGDTGGEVSDRTAVQNSLARRRDGETE